MIQAQTKTFSTKKGFWEQITFKVGAKDCVEIYGEVTQPKAPSIESLDRRYEASDKDWITDWLNDEDDPCSPE